MLNLYSLKKFKLKKNTHNSKTTHYKINEKK